MTQTQWTLVWDKHPEKRITFTKTPEDPNLTLMQGEGFQGPNDPVPVVGATLQSGVLWSMVLDKDQPVVVDTPMARDVWETLLCKGWIRND